jgi:hypothetical protein
MKIDKFFYNRGESVLQSNLWPCRHYSKTVLVCSEEVSRTNFTNKASPNTPSPTLSLIKMNISLTELVNLLILEATSILNKEKISKVIKSEIKWLDNFLKAANKITNHKNVNLFMSILRLIRTKILILSKNNFQALLKFIGANRF